MGHTCSYNSHDSYNAMLPIVHAAGLKIPPTKDVLCEFVGHVTAAYTRRPGLSVGAERILATISDGFSLDPGRFLSYTKNGREESDMSRL